MQASFSSILHLYLIPGMATSIRRSIARSRNIVKLQIVIRRPACEKHSSGVYKQTKESPAVARTIR